MKKILYIILFLMLFSGLFAVEDGTGNDIVRNSSVSTTTYRGTTDITLSNTSGSLYITDINNTNKLLLDPNLILVYEDFDFGTQGSSGIDISNGKVFALTNRTILPFQTLIMPSTDNSIITKGTIAMINSGQEYLFKSSETFTGAVIFDQIILASAGDFGAGLGTCFDIRISTPNFNPFSTLLLNDTVFSDFDDIGTIEGLGSVGFHFLNVLGCKDGLKFINISSLDLLAVNFVDGVGAGNSCIDMSTGTAQVVCNFNTISANATDDSYAFNIHPDDNGYDPNFRATLIGNVVNSTNTFAPGSIDQTDPRVQFVGNVGIPDSTAFTSMYYTGLSSDTTASGTPINFVTEWQEDKLERFISVSTGTITYTGLEDVSVLVELDLTISVSTSSSWTFYIYKNDIQVANFPYSFDITIQLVDDKFHIFPGARIDLSTNDYLEIRVSGDGGTLTTYDGKGVIQKL